MPLRRDPRSKPGAAGWRRHWPWLLAALAILAVPLAVFRQPLADRMWPQARIDTALEQGEAALAAHVAALWSAREDRYSEIRGNPSAPRKHIEMYLIGG